jgi:superfamily II DNA or RNA helicase
MKKRQLKRKIKKAELLKPKSVYKGNQSYAVAGERNIEGIMAQKGFYLNVGMTSNGRAVEDRLKDRDYASKNAAGRWRICDRSRIGKHRDEELHRLLESRGWLRNPNNSGNTEEFFAPGVKSVEEAIKIYNECVNEMLHGIKRSNNYKPRAYQKKIIDKAIKAYFKNPYEFRFLLAMCPRSGKNFVVTEIIRGINEIEPGTIKRVLFASYVPSVFSTLIDDINNHINYEDFKVVKSNTLKQVTPVPVGTVVIEVCSAQSALNHPNTVSHIFNTPYDLLIIDEEHFGADKEKAEKKLWSKIENGGRIALSGTAYKSLESGDYVEGDIGHFDYIAQQKYQETQPPLARLNPVMCLYEQNLSAEFIKRMEERGFEGDDAFNMSKLFAATKPEKNKLSQFNYPDLVGDFFDNLHEPRKGAYFNLFKGIEISQAGRNHLLINMPSSTAACEALCEYLRTHSHWGKYTIINASGQTSKSVKDIKEVQRIIATKERTITVTCGRFKMGTSVPEWHIVLMLDGGESKADYIQTIGRVATPHYEKDSAGNVCEIKKEQAHVFDMCPHRILRILYAEAEVTTSRHQNIKERLIEAREAYNVWRRGDTMEKISVDDILRESYSSNPLGRSIGGASSYAIGKLEQDLEAQSILALLKKAAKGNEDIDRRKLKKGNVKKEKEDEKTPSGTGKKTNSKKKEQEWKDQLSALSKSLGSYSYATGFVQDTCKKILDMGDYRFKDFTGIDIADFEKLLIARHLKERNLDRHLAASKGYYKELDKLSPSKKFDKVMEGVGLLERYARDQQPGTPYSLAKEMLDKSGAKWDNPKSKFLCPAVASGTLYFDIIRRLDEGLKKIIPNQVDRLEHIINKMVYGVSCNKAAYHVGCQTYNFLYGELGIDNNLVYGNLLQEDELKEIKDMRFDGWFMNPPFQGQPKTKYGEKTSKAAGNNDLWPGFVRLATTHTKAGGTIGAIHPSSWRRPRLPKKKPKEVELFSLLTKDNYMKFLSIHDSKEGKTTFGAGTRYDWYIIEKRRPSKKELTTVRAQGSDDTQEVDLSRRTWLPNFDFAKIDALVETYEKENLSGDVICNSAYHHQRSYVSDKLTKEFCYKLVHLTPSKGARFYYSNRNDKGHFGIPKVIFGDTGATNAIIDYEGDYGMAENAIALLISSEEDGEKLKVFLLSEEFNQILSACSWSNFRIDWKMFEYFKEGFWRDEEK